MPIKVFAELIEEKAKEGIKVCEIGCFNGETTHMYAPIIKKYNGHITVIDWFIGNTSVDSNHCHGYKPNNAEITKEEFITRLGPELMEYITIIQGSSQEQEIIKSVPDNYFDILFIDASHTYEDVKNDIINYMPKVKNGGILCGHDCETLDFVNCFSPEELKSDYISKNINDKSYGLHAGVIQAVFDIFGKDVELRDDPYPGMGVSIWIKYINR